MLTMYWPRSHHLILCNYRGIKNIKVKEADTSRGDAFQLRAHPHLQRFQIRKWWALARLRNLVIWSPWYEMHFMATR